MDSNTETEAWDVDALRTGSQDEAELEEGNFKRSRTWVEGTVIQVCFAMEKNVRAKRRQNTMGDDPLVFDGRDPVDNQEGDVTVMQKILQIGRRQLGPIRKGKPSKLSPLVEAKARAERLRTVKADLQKLKKEKEEEEIITTWSFEVRETKEDCCRGSSTTASVKHQSETSKQLPIKLSPGTHRGSKFSDSEPGSSSPHTKGSPSKLFLQDQVILRKSPEKSGTVVDNANFQAPVSPFTMDGIVRNHTEHQLPKHPGVHEVKLHLETCKSCREKELPKFSSTHIAEKPTMPLMLGSHSMEDPCTENSEHAKATPNKLTDTF
ncbi:hypothetical protein NC652_024468 [Populus alba x Populus x berolinensis]|nr:hypothetical protein NC652_024468 [Populus alba x Populus x berolinensis]